MTPVGETLRRERLKRNLDIEEISRELKISARFIQAIESDEFEKLPGGVFAKSFVRQYARLLGLDEDQISGQVQQNLAPVPEFSQLPEKEKPARFTAISVPKVDEWQTVGDRRFHWSGWLSALGLVAVMLVCSAVYTWMQRPRSAVLSHDTTVQNAAAQTAPAPVQTPSPVAAAQTPAEQPSAQAPSQPVNTAAAPPSPVASQTKPPETRTNQPNSTDAKPVAPASLAPLADKVLPAGTGPVKVTITADEAVWVLARADSKYVFSATMDPNTTRTVEGNRDVMLRLGNAGGVTISLNGKPIGPAGPKGQVRTIQFTSGGFQIVPAAKPPLDAPPARL